MFQLAQLPRTIDAALRDIEAKKAEIRKSALADLVRHADGASRANVVVALRKLLRKDVDTEVRAQAALACADAELSELRPDLFEALTDKSPRVTQMVLLALGELPLQVTAAEVTQLSAFLHSELPALRYQALSTLYRLRDADTAPNLWLAIRDPDPEICWLGWQLLDDWQTKVDTALASVVGRKVHSETVLNLREHEHLQALVVLAEQAPPRVKVEAGILLLRLNEPKALELLLPLLERARGLESGQLERAIQRMGEANCQSSVPWLSKHARSGWFEGPLGWVSLCALARMGDPAARATVTAELRSSSARKRERAFSSVRSWAGQ